MAFKLASKVVICCIIDVLIVALAASGATRSEQSPGQRPVISGEVLVILHWAMCSISHPWPLKWPATEVHLFTAATNFDCCNRS